MRVGLGTEPCLKTSWGVVHMGNGEQGCHASRTLLDMSMGVGSRVRKPDCL